MPINKIKNPVAHLLKNCKYHAKKKGVKFTLIHADIKIPEVCPVYGIPLTFYGPADSTPSIDRIIPELGYVPRNIVVVSFRANRLKADGEPKEHYKLFQFYSFLEMEREL